MPPRPPRPANSPVRAGGCRRGPGRRCGPAEGCALFLEADLIRPRQERHLQHPHALHTLRGPAGGGQEGVRKGSGRGQEGVRRGSGGKVSVKHRRPWSLRTRLKVKNTRGIFKVCCTSDAQRKTT
eukprot:1188417-Prorocentrum_minimum.AAC.2